MKEITLYHNPKCSKSREALRLLKDKPISLTVIEYLHNTPTKDMLLKIIEFLNIQTRDLIRQNETLFNELNLDNPNVADDDLLDAMINYPILIQRPIAVCDNKALIGRPPEKVLTLIDD